MTCLAPAAGVDVGESHPDLGSHLAAEALRCSQDGRGIARLVELARKHGGIGIEPVSTLLANGWVR